MPIVKKTDWKYSDLKGMANHVYDLFVRQMQPPALSSLGGCSYAGVRGECAVGCLWPRELAEQVQLRHACGIQALVQDEVVEMPDDVAPGHLVLMQRWHDEDVQDSESQWERHRTFPRLDLIDNPLTFGSAEN
jgi:hypothetical protein